jgi:superfamily I DNA/RNA helicase
LAEDNLQAALDEERRLLYVAMTRAKRLLILAHFDVGRFMRYSPSRFLREIV